jgi:CheY-like chemotaxis protein
MPILNFLIVEDEPLNRQVLFTMLTIMGHQVTEAADGPEALGLLTSSNPFDAILLDVQLPGLDGLAVLAALREHPETRRSPIVCISARAHPEDRAPLRRAERRGLRQPKALGFSSRS